MNQALAEQTIINELEHYDVILIAPLISRCLTVEEIFAERAYRHEQLALYDVVAECYPDYLPALKEVLNSNRLSQCNMFIAKRKFVDEYCSWLFDILAKTEEKIAHEGYDPNHARLYGYFSEFLLNVYVLKNNLKRKIFCRLFLIEEKVKDNALKRILRKIPYLVRFVHYFKQYKNTFKQKRNYADFSATILHHNFPSGGLFLIAELTPKNDSSNFMASLRKIITELQNEASRKNATLITRIRLQSEIHQSMKESLRTMGVRILQD